MNWQALWADGWVISAHALAACAAILLGALQFALPKGTARHRFMGLLWVALMAMVAVSSFWIHTFRMVGPFSVIHLLSAITLVALAYAVAAALQGRIAAHRRAMMQTYVLALVVTGVFTLWPGRTMHAVLFGG
ncbi:MAG: DUF2306 domain-containing protein [Roseovarius sp.]